MPTNFQRRLGFMAFEPLGCRVSGKGFGLELRALSLGL